MRSKTIALIADIICDELRVEGDDGLRALAKQRLRDGCAGCVDERE